MHDTTFEYLMPTDEQRARMSLARQALAGCWAALDEVVPDGPDKTYLIRKLREVGMWVNISITRQPDGAPRA